MVDALIRELFLRKDYLQDKQIQSIYFGGGTPSLLNDRELSNILEVIYQTYSISSEAEITLEANPDDVTPNMLHNLKSAGINRLSIGIQTFDNERLKFINRAHTAEEAMRSLNFAKEAGFENITADLIYAIPPDDVPYWENDLEKMLSFDLPHLSVYGLTIEEKTVFGNWARKGKLKEVTEDISARQFQIAHEVLTAHGYEHYEVSNYARAGNYSQHNSAYWKDQKYLGIGPGAHSYDGETRASTISSNAKYLAAITSDNLPLTTEDLSPSDLANEYLLTHLRTVWGLSISDFKAKHSKDLMSDHGEVIREFCSRGMMTVNSDTIVLTLDGLMFADEISWRLFYDQE